MKRMIFASVVACATLTAATEASAFAIAFEWGQTKKCFDSKSPPIALSKVPKNTAKIRFLMVDLDAPRYPHGGGTVAYTGETALPYGAFTYKGPCPPAPHTYEFRAEALDASGKVIAKARASRKFP